MGFATCVRFQKEGSREQAGREFQLGANLA